MSLFALVASATIITGPALAQIAPPPGPAPAPTANRPKLLADPGGKSLVRRDAEGKLVRLDTTAEEVALGVLAVDAGIRAKVDAILLERFKLLDTIVADNTGLLARILTTDPSAQEARFAALRDFLALLQPLRDRGLLRDEIGAILPPELKTRFDALVAEYWEACVADGLTEPASPAEKKALAAATVTDPRAARRNQVSLKESMRVISQEINRSCERQIGAREAAFREATARLGLSAAQRAAIKSVFADLHSTTGGQPTPEQSRAATVKAFALLRPPQKATLLCDVLAPAHPT